jgi:hypothetical protein
MHVKEVLKAQVSKSDKFEFKNMNYRPGIVVNSYNHNYPEAEVGEL